MSARESTPQRLDPLGAFDAWPLAVLCGLAAVVGSAVLAAGALAAGRSPVLAGASILLTAAAMALTAVAAHPARAPFSRAVFVGALLLAVSAVAAGQSAGAGMAAVSIGEPFVVALFFVATASFRTGRELTLAGVAAAVVVSANAWRLGAVDEAAPSAVLLGELFAGAPVIGAALGAAAYSRSFVRAVAGWRERATAEAREFALEQREELAAEVHENVLGVLNREMLPFFRRLLEKDAIDEQDSANARAVAEVVRSIIVAENDRSWLDDVLLREWRRSAEGAQPAGVVHDPERLIGEVTGTARAALIAYVILVLRRRADPAEAGLRIEARTEGRARVLDVGVSSSAIGRHGRPDVRPYLSVLSATFDAVSVSRSPDRLTLRLVHGDSNDRRDPAGGPG